MAEAIVNPSTPWAFLTPDVSAKLSLAIYVHIGALAVLVWDILYHLQADIQIARRHRLGLATGAFFLSRISILVYAAARAALLTAPLEHCHQLQTAILPFLALSATCMSFLSYLRVCAVYGNRKALIGIFGLLWAAVVVAVALTVANITAETIGPTDFCIESVIKPTFVQSGPMTLLVFDTSVFVAMTYRFYSLYETQDPSEGSGSLTSKARRGFNIAIFGTSLPAFSKALLHECQFYYLVGPVTKISLIVCMYAIPGPYWVLLISSHLILVNIVTCSVFRNIKGMRGDALGQSYEGRRILGTGPTYATDQRSAQPGVELRFQSSARCNDGTQLQHMVTTQNSDLPYEVSIKVDKMTVRHDDIFVETISERGEKDSVTNSV